MTAGILAGSASSDRWLEALCERVLDCSSTGVLSWYMHPGAFLAWMHDAHGRFVSHFYVETVGFKELGQSNER